MMTCSAKVEVTSAVNLTVIKKGQMSRFSHSENKWHFIITFQILVDGKSIDTKVIWGKDI